jgi:hypothetical protein
MLQFLILCDGLLGNRMDYSETMFFDVDDRPGSLLIGGNFDGFESHDVIHSLDGDVAGHARIGDTGRMPWRSGRSGGWAVVVVVVRINDVVSRRCCRCSGTCSFVGAWT